MAQVSTTPAVEPPTSRDAGLGDRGMLRRWRPRHPAVSMAPPPSPPSEPLVQRVLRSRGLDEPTSAAAFLLPTLNALHDPSLIPDLDRAAARILAALQQGERIAIYGDYDADGITASAILYHTLRALRPSCVDHGPGQHPQVVTYLPHRLHEGYGLNGEALAQLASQGVRVVVTVDCGITAVAEAARAAELGIDLIITDHHNPPATIEALPKASAVVHPARPDSAYPFKDLCGAGVAFKIAWRLSTLASGRERADKHLRATLIEMLALTALGTVADIVPLVDENRAIAHVGLRGVRRSSIEGLRALVQASGLDGESIDEEHVGFALAPRLNAAGRIDHAAEALELLTTATGQRAHDIARQLNALNDQRRQAERQIEQHAAALAVESGQTGEDHRAIVLAHADWHPGVLGIVCSRLVERFARPTILLQHRPDGLCAGSARSVEGFSLAHALGLCAEHLGTHGGHAMAAGLKLQHDNLHAFRIAFVDHANRSLSPQDLVPLLHVDAVADLSELTIEAVAELDRLRPFGRGNPRVNVLVRGARVAGLPSRFGASGQHLGLHVRQGTGSGDRPLRLVAWNAPRDLAELVPGQVVDIVVEPKISTWGGRRRVEPELRDLRPVTA